MYITTTEWFGVSICIMCLIWSTMSGGCFQAKHRLSELYRAPATSTTLSTITKSTDCTNGNEPMMCHTNRITCGGRGIKAIH